MELVGGERSGERLVNEKYKKGTEETRKGGKREEKGKGGGRMQAIETKHFGKKRQTFEGTCQPSFDAKGTVNTGKIAG